MKVFIITEGGKNVGFGHLTRCIAIYQAFEKQGIYPQFIINGDRTVKEFLKNQKYIVFNWLKQKDRLFRITKDADILIIDSYLANLNFYNKISEYVKVPVYIDDIKRLNYPKGIVVNGNIYAQTLKYPKRKDVTYLLATKYILLRKEFWDIPKKKIRKNIQSVMITFGGGDARGMAPKILRLLEEEYSEFTRYVVIGKGFNNIEEIKELKNKKIRLIYNPDGNGIRRLMLRSDMAISAGGQTLYELARIGVPTIGICVSKNQERNLEGWRKAGFIEYLGSYKDKISILKLKKIIDKLIPRAARANRNQIGRKLVDGKGIDRIVHTLMNQRINLENKKYTINKVNNNIKLRKARKNDCYDLWIWRNHTEIRHWSFNREEIEYEKHREWFEKKIKDRDVNIYIAENIKEEKVGQIRFEINKKKLASVNINLNPKFFGKGLGSKIIRKGTESFLKENRNVKEVIAEILDENITSKKAFQKVGYNFSHNTFKGGKRVAIFKLEVLNDRF